MAVQGDVKATGTELAKNEQSCQIDPTNGESDTLEIPMILNYEFWLSSHQ